MVGGYDSRMKFYQKPACTTCRKAKAWLRENGVKTDDIDLNRGLSEAELDALIGSRDYKPFLNPRMSYTVNAT